MPGRQGVTGLGGYNGGTGVMVGGCDWPARLRSQGY